MHEQAMDKIRKMNAMNEKQQKLMKERKEKSKLGDLSLTTILSLEGSTIYKSENINLP